MLLRHKLHHMAAVGHRSKNVAISELHSRYIPGLSRNCLQLTDATLVLNLGICL